MPSTTTSRLEGLTTAVAVKAPCRVATTTNLASLAGLLTIDGVTVAAGDRVLVKDQTDASENGIYVAGTADWVRAKDFNGSLDIVQGTQVRVTSGSTQSRTGWEVSSANPITIWTSEIAFVRVIYSLAEDGVSVFTPEQFGAVGDGVTNDNTAFVLLSAAVNAADGGIIEFNNTTYLVGAQSFAGATGLGYAYLISDVIDIRNCTRPVIIRGNGAKLKAAAGLKYGSFNPTTGAAAGTSSNTDNIAYGVSFLTFVSCSQVTVEDLEIDGNVDNYTLGGLWNAGDGGRQIAAFGLEFISCDQVDVRNVYTHHNPLDGIAIGYTGITVTDLKKPHTLINVRSEYNGRQGLSWFGGNGLTAIGCSFSYTGRNTAGVSTSPGAGVDIEAENGVCRNGMFIDCEMIHNTGVGVVADSGDSADASFLRCEITGTDYYSVWPRKPGLSFIDCIIRGQGVAPYSSSVPGEATLFSRCTFSAKLSESPTGTLYLPSNYLMDFGGGDTGVVFDLCAFDTGGHATAIMPLTNNSTYRNCRFKQDSAATPTITAVLEGNNEFTVGGTVTFGGVGNRGRLSVNSAVVGLALTDPAGGATVDAEARAQINTIIDVLQSKGFAT